MTGWLAVCLAIQPAGAQKFLDKINKALDKASDAINKTTDNLLGTESASGGNLPTGNLPPVIEPRVTDNTVIIEVKDDFYVYWTGISEGIFWLADGEYWSPYDTLGNKVSEFRHLQRSKIRHNVPVYKNGVAPVYDGDGLALIDKQGNKVKTIPNVREHSQFNNRGIASGVLYKDEGSKSSTFHRWVPYAVFLIRKGRSSFRPLKRK